MMTALQRLPLLGHTRWAQSLHDSSHVRVIWCLIGINLHVSPDHQCIQQESLLGSIQIEGEFGLTLLGMHLARPDAVSSDMITSDILEYMFYPLIPFLSPSLHFPLIEPYVRFGHDHRCTYWRRDFS